MKEPVELIIFDCDGVLVDSEILGNFIIHQEITIRGHSLTLEEYMEFGVGRRKEELEHILKDKGVHIADDFWDEILKKMLELFETELEVIEGVKHTLDNLQQKKCVASNSPGKKLDYVLKLMDIKHHFEDAMFHGEMVTCGKPAPDLFLLAAKTLDVPPSRCLVIEDSLAGIQAGRSAGMRVWGFTGGSHCTPSYADKIHNEDLEIVFDDMSKLVELIEKR